jgi:hypothetical protein
MQQRPNESYVPVIVVPGALGEGWELILALVASVEPANMAMHVHQIVMVVAAGQTTRTQLESALENVSSCRNVSMIFNKAPKWYQGQSDSYYYYGADRNDGEKAT